MIKIRSIAVKATWWSIIDVLMRQGIRYIIIIMLARMLAPSDFGVIAMINVFIGIANTFIDSGFSSALIQKQDVTKRDESTVFYFNAFMGLLVGLALTGSASWIAEFFHQPILKLITICMGINLFINSLGAIHNTLLVKHLKFKVIMKIGVVTTSLSGLLALFLAWKGFGVWSLVWQTICSSLLTVILLWVLHPWRPQLIFSFLSLRKLFKFGSFLMLSGILYTFYSHFYEILIGKFFTASELGLYSRAETTQKMQTNILEATINRVALPVFSKNAVNKEILLKSMKKVLHTMMFINIPLMLGMIIVAKTFILSIFGEKWLMCVPILQVLCLSGILWPLHTVNLKVLNAQGRSDLFFRIEIIKIIIGFIAIIWASFYGIMGIAWSQPITGVIGFSINAFYSGRLLKYGPLRQTIDLLPSLGAGAVMMLVIWYLGELLSLQAPFELALLSICGLIVYLLISKIFKVTGLKIVYESFGLFHKEKTTQPLNV